MSEMTKHLVIDIKTGYVYGLKLDAEGQCKAVAPYNSSIETIDTGRVVSKFGPLLAANGNDNPMLRPSAPPTLPFGSTTVCVELRNDSEKGQLFTIVWPSKEEADKGTMPVVAKKELPDDLVKAGIAPQPKKEKGAKGAGVDDEATLKEALNNIDAMIGLDTAKHDIKQNIAVARFNRLKEEMGLNTKPISRHMVFTGNPGTGKTTFAREVAKVYHALGFIEKPTVHEVKREDLVAGFVGQTALKTKEAIDKAKGGILFIDEAYALSREAGAADSKDFGREAIDTLVAAMENMREDLIVIVAGYTDPMKNFIDANPGLKSRFMTYINFEDYTVPQLSEIMDVMVADRGYKMTPEAREFAVELIESEKTQAKKDFGNGRTVRNLVEKAEKELAMRLESEHKLAKNSGIPEDELKTALTTITLEDVKNITLEGLSSKKEVRIGFGSAAEKKPANDVPVKPGALDAVPAAKKRIGFGPAR
jgi:AAA+ superfamily predicted ATPase